MEANGLHREAALLSNTLHTFRDDDVKGVKPVIDEILRKREAWKKVVGKMNHFTKFGKLPEEKQDPVTVETPSGSSLSDLRVKLQLLNVNISKYSKKLEQTPDHSKAEQWREELAKMGALKMELKQQIVLKRHETT